MGPGELCQRSGIGASTATARILAIAGMTSTVPGLTRGPTAGRHVGAVRLKGEPSVAIEQATTGPMTASTSSDTEYRARNVGAIRGRTHAERCSGASPQTPSQARNDGSAIAKPAVVRDIESGPMATRASETRTERSGCVLE